MKIGTTRRDVVWNYVGTAASASSGFILLPFLLAYLSSEELGLWYVFLAISNLSQLLEWGFEPTLARNIVYVMSGTRCLSKEGVERSDDDAEVDWHLMRVVLVATKRIFAVISVLTSVIVCTAGTAYVAYVARDVVSATIWISWGIFCVAIFMNLYFLYAVTYLRGVGDVAGENRGKTIGRLTQLGVSVVALFLGFGLVGAALGYMANGVAMRVMTSRYFRAHGEVTGPLSEHDEPVGKDELKDVFSSVSFIAFRDIGVQLASWATTQATTIICSLFLSLEDTGTYSVLLQFGNAICSMSAAYVGSYLPSFQSAYSCGDLARQREIVGRGTVVYWALAPLGALVVIFVVFPILPFLKPGVRLDTPLFVLICVYLALLNHHHLFCRFIGSMNRIPYAPAYIVSAAAGIALSAGMLVVFGGRAWALVVGQALAQLAYNNWRWPRYVARELGSGYFALVGSGFTWLSRRIAGFLSGAVRRLGTRRGA